MTEAVIANTELGGYAHRKFQRLRAVVMGDEQRAERQQDELADLEHRVRAGEWLKTGSVAKLLGIGRTKAHALVTKGVIRHRTIAGGVQRLANPEDVLRLLEESRQVRGAESIDPPPKA